MTNKTEEIPAVSPTPFRLGHRKSLDGLRGAAILMVLLLHLELANSSVGFLGVNLFFGLSGFLITALLLEEWDACGRVSLRNFYARRALRLLPALLALIAAFLVYAWTNTSASMRAQYFREAAFSLFYSMNWAQAFGLIHAHILAHTWSLSIEEQFYFIWPAALLIMLRFCARRTIFNLLLLGAALSCVVRIVLWHTPLLIDTPRLTNGLDTRADSLLLGCAAAVCAQSNLLRLIPRAQAALKVAAWVSVAGLVLQCLLLYPEEDNLSFVDWTLASVFGALIILALVVSPPGILNSILSNPLLVHVGKISYGLYLWHNPVIICLHRQGWPRWQNAVLALPFIVLITLASYYLIERPCLRLKARFEPLERRQTGS